MPPAPSPPVPPGRFSALSPCMAGICVYAWLATNVSRFGWDFPNCSTENPILQEAPEFQANQDTWSHSTLTPKLSTVGAQTSRSLNHNRCAISICLIHARMNKLRLLLPGSDRTEAV